MFFPPETVEISECCVKRELCHAFNTNLRMLLRAARLCPPRSILGQGTKNLREHRFTGEPSRSAAPLLKILLSWRITPKEEKKKGICKRGLRQGERRRLAWGRLLPTCRARRETWKQRARAERRVGWRRLREPAGVVKCSELYF